jgi:hypothetical protein
VGSPAPQGIQIYNPNTGTWILAGGGYDIIGTQDQFHFIDQPMTGDGSIIARVVLQTKTEGSSKAGIMIRANNSINSPYFALFVTPAHNLLAQWRGTTGGPTSSSRVDHKNGVPYDWNTPVYVKITRTGNSYTASISQDGVTWTNVHRDTNIAIDLGATPLVGLVDCSHNISYTSAVTFDNVSIGNS